MAKFPMIIVNTSLPLLLQLKPSPNNISIDRNKVYSKTQTLGGFVFEHWGEQPRIMRVKGRTFPKLGRNSDFSHSEAGVEAAMFALQQLYSLDKRSLVSITALAKSLLSGGMSALSKAPKTLSTTYIYYRTDLYTGFFTNFKWEQNAEQHPRHYEYEFEFMVTQTAQSALTETMLNSPLGQIGAAAAGLAVSGSQVLPLIKSFNIKGFSGLNI